MTASKTNPEAELSAELSEAGEAADRLIESLVSRGLSPLAIASALLGGSLGLLSQTLGDEAVMQVLHNAAAGVRAGELRSGRA
jgi:hypothetical protein